MAVISVSMEGQTPHTATIACENGYIQVDTVLLGDRATVHDLENGTQRVIEAGDNVPAMQHEIADMEQAVQTGENPTASRTAAVMRLMTQARRQWGISYPFEKSNL